MQVILDSVVGVFEVVIPYKARLFEKLRQIFLRSNGYNRTHSLVSELGGNPGEVTLLLRDWQSGDRSAESKLFELLLPDLQKIAAAHYVIWTEAGLDLHAAQLDRILRHLG